MDRAADHDFCITTKKAYVVGLKTLKDRSLSKPCRICQNFLCEPCVNCVASCSKDCTASRGTCGCVFHSDCVGRWAKKNNTCPHCAKSWSEMERVMV